MYTHTFDLELAFYRIEFGEMETLITTESDVLHIEVDLINSSKLLFSDSNALKDTDGVITGTLVGVAAEIGYIEGFSTAARFDDITGFAQLSDTILVLVDSGNHCLRLVNRKVLQSSPLVGQCETAGYKNGIDAMFYFPSSVIKDPRYLKLLLVTDNGNSALRKVDLTNNLTTTVIEKSNDLYKPTGIVYDYLSGNWLLVNDHYIGIYQSEPKNFSIITGSTSSGSLDGELSVARFSYPTGVCLLSDKMFVVADWDNHRLRVVNTADNSVSSVCDGGRDTVDGAPETCKLNDPSSLMANEGALYIGQYKAIRYLPCKYDLQIVLNHLLVYFLLKIHQVVFKAGSCKKMLTETDAL